MNSPATSDLHFGSNPMSPADPIAGHICDLASAAGVRAAVFLALRGRGDGDVQITGRWVGGDLRPHVQAWVRSAESLAGMGWGACDVLPADRPALRRIRSGGRPTKVLGGLVTLDGEVLGWLALFPARLGSTGLQTS